jgi:formylglycine-generating enzyme required for sulfatase activity
VYFVSYSDCEAFCEKLNQMLFYQLPEGYRFTIPTEAQWEYAAYGGRKSKGYTYSGSNIINKVAWWEDNSEKKNHEVGLKFSNELGIYDMSGNVWEWCSDYFDGDYYIISPSSDPTGPDFGYNRALRGGSWRSTTQGCRVSCRYTASPNERASNCGFRLALVKE